MGKKAKTKRKDKYKAFMDGMIKYREGFINKKIALLEKMFADESLKTKIMSKDKATMNKLERAVSDTVTSLNIETIEQLDQIKNKIKEDQTKKAKFKYKPKLT